VICGDTGLSVDSRLWASPRLATAPDRPGPLADVGPKFQKITLPMSFVGKGRFSQVAHRKVAAGYHGDALPSELRGREKPPDPGALSPSDRFLLQRSLSDESPRYQGTRKRMIPGGPRGIGGL
jgi:hypothetical protein